jgi:phage shock protein E
MKIEKMISENQCAIIDVRTVEEFKAGNVKGSINIPLHQIMQRMEEIKKLKTPLVLCCASGGRSSQAEDFLSRQGIECVNGGSWMDVEFLQKQAA